jgi:hypothetical protein
LGKNDSSKPPAHHGGNDEPARPDDSPHGNTGSSLDVISRFRLNRRHLVADVISHLRLNGPYLVAIAATLTALAWALRPR